MDAAVDAPAACAVYRRRRPERTPLYQSVQGNLETYLALARDGHPGGDGVPQYVEREFRRYLECGILAHGFARARCAECSHDFLIAFSCKGRGYAVRRNMRSGGLSKSKIGVGIKLLVAAGPAAHSAYCSATERGDQLVGRSELARLHH